MLAWLLLAALLPAHADTIYLRNGNEMEGTIVGQNGREVTINIGYGTVTLKRADISRIKRTNDDALVEREFASGNRVPAGAENLNDLYQAASQAREKALDVRNRLKQLDDAAKEAQDELPRLRENYDSAAQRLQGLSLNGNRAAYNATVEELNSIRTQMQIDGNRIQDAQSQKREGQKEIQDYSEALSQLRQALTRPEIRQSERVATGWQARYYAWLRREMSSMATDFRQDVVDSLDHSGHVVVQALLNGRVPARLLVDTGASISVLYPSVTDELGLAGAPAIGNTRIVLGDGHTVDARIVRLDSIAVGRTAVRGSAVALVNSPPPGIDGLLGMSFLSHFVVRVDSANGRLILDELK